MTDTRPAPALNITDIVQEGPIPPRVQNATWPNVLHTRIADIVAQKGPPPGRHASSRTSGTWSP